MLYIKETEYQPVLMYFNEIIRLKLNIKYTHDFAIRRVVLDKVHDALKELDNSFGFMIYEAFRPKKRQIELWSSMWQRLSSDNPEWDENRLTQECSIFVANPYTTGSGHQSGTAIDITLFDIATGRELDMGTEVQEFCQKTKTDNPYITDKQRKNRQLLRKTLENVGLINYPEEWWHYSYGDRLWAEITGATETLYDLINH